MGEDRRELYFRASIIAKKMLSVPLANKNIRKIQKKKKNCVATEKNIEGGAER